MKWPVDEAGRLACLSLVGTEAADDGERQTDADVGENDAQPDVVVQRVHEREHARLLLLRLLDHDADSEVHERLGEVDHPLAFRRDRQRRYRDVRRLSPSVDTGTQVK